MDGRADAANGESDSGWRGAVFRSALTFHLGHEHAFIIDFLAGHRACSPLPASSCPSHPRNQRLGATGSLAALPGLRGIQLHCGSVEHELTAQQRSAFFDASGTRTPWRGL
jgi:hypothetical protein